MASHEIKFKILDNTNLDIILSLMQKLYLHDHIQYDENVARLTLVNLLKDNTKGKVWLIQYNEEAVGYCVLTFGYSLEFHGRDALMDELYISDDYRGKGIGQATIQFIEGVCKELKIDALHLHVGRTNSKAQTLYEKVGFRELDRNIMTKWIK